VWVAALDPGRATGFVAIASDVEYDDHAPQRRRVTWTCAVAKRSRQRC